VSCKGYAGCGGQDEHEGDNIVYGQTEASPGCTQSRVDDPIEVRVNTVGRPLPGIECKIVDPQNW